MQWKLELCKEVQRVLANRPAQTEQRVEEAGEAEEELQLSTSTSNCPTREKPC